MAYKAMDAKWAGKCKACGGAIAAGDSIVWESLHKTTFHPDCKPSAPVVSPGLAAPLSPKAAGASVPPKSKPGPAYKPKAKKAVFSSILSVPNPETMGPAPATQKGKGIHVLQTAGILPKAMGMVCTTLDAAIHAFGIIPGAKFCRPCPITARHGFVDSRVVKDLDGLKSLWAETMAADPKGEMIIMPLIEAAHNCVWRPGLLAIGPGHDGATAGQDSITVFLQEEYAPVWRDLAIKAGVNPETAAPFIESVSHDGIDTVVTQIRAGVKGAPTEPDWNPSPMTVGEVITINQASKADPDAMLAWEHKATTLKPGFHIVFDEGGNLGDHWSVHAQLNGIAVVTSFKPFVGQTLGQLGQQLPPLEPQAIVFGFLGGLLSPVMAADTATNRRKRTRATVAAILGTHHGLRMGGDGGVHLGASVALFLRLGQAAVWGEARHAHSHAKGFDAKDLPQVKAIKGLSRQQIFTEILDDWTRGRKGLREVVRCFHLNWGGGGFGGKAWAAIGHSIVNLDTAMLDLIKVPSRLNAKRVIAALTTAVNLAHNGGGSCFLNKFCSVSWFDMAAGLDPRAALFAGPVWYEATLADTGARMDLLSAIEQMDPIEVGHKAPTGNVLAAVKPHAGEKLIGVSVQEDYTPKPPFTPGGKVGSFDTVALGSSAVAAGIPGVPVKAYVKPGGGAVLHTQIELSAGGYVSGEISVPNARWVAKVAAAMAGSKLAPSMSGSSVSYAVCEVGPDVITLGGVILLTLGTDTK